MTRPGDGEIKGRKVRFGSVGCFYWSFRCVAQCAAKIRNVRVKLISLTLLGSLHIAEMSHVAMSTISAPPARARPIIARAAGPPVHCPGAGCRPEGWRTCVSLGPDQHCQALQFRARRGGQASQANRLLTGRSRVVVIKTRVVRHSARSSPLAAHLKYLGREGVTRDGEKARMFSPSDDAVDPKAFAERCQDDRHHFRFIVSPEDATDLADLRSFSRDLMRQMEKDLGTDLDWVGVDHWNTDNPHVHIILRGKLDDGQDLVISRDYIKEGMRARAQDLVTLELGPRTDLDIRHHLERQVEAERWTQLDRQLVRDGRRTGIIDTATDTDRKPDEFHTLKVGRLRKLQALGLADQVGPGQWVIGDDAEATLCELGERGDIIKRMHRALTDQGIERGSSGFVLAGESLDNAHHRSAGEARPRR